MTLQTRNGPNSPGEVFPPTDECSAKGDEEPRTLPRQPDRQAPGGTATMVAFGRGVGVNDEVRDATAASMLGGIPSAVLALAIENSQVRTVARPLLRAISLGIVDHNSLRMAAIDEALNAAVGGQCSQVVVLGAGLDTRAWRMSALRSSTVFEVDHPAIQVDKRQRASSHTPLAESVRFIPTDFEDQDLARQLSRYGYDRDRQAFWIWEGVTPFLTDAALQATMSQVADCSAPGSTLAMTYLHRSDTKRGQVLTSALKKFVRVVGERAPARPRSAAEMARILARHQFSVKTSTSSKDWARQHCGGTRLPDLLKAERLLIAMRE